LEHRDLACEEFWNESLERSRRRRAEQAASHAPERIQRSAAVATAAVVLGTAPAAAAVSGKVLGGGGGGSGPGLDAKVQALATELKNRVEPRVPAAAPPPSASSQVVTSTSTATSTASTAPAQNRASQPKAATSGGAAAPAEASSALRPARDGQGSHALATAATTDDGEAGKPGGGVQQLQRALGVPVDGDFGRATERALKRWQKKRGLLADGVAGEATRGALGLGSGPSLERKVAPRRAKGKRRGAAPRRRGGGGVRSLQVALGLGADGVFGPATERALKRWQRAHGLTPDGVAGPRTRSKLGLGPGRTLKRAKRTRARGRRGGGGGSSSALQRVIAAANSIATKPYRYGGGHGSFNDTGYDCSGSVSYALHGGGLLSTPLDSSGFMSYGRPGPGRHITIYANPGHVYMVIDGRRFDTSARRQGGSRWSGSGRSGGGYVVRHPAGY
jgi:peptidoglycan hydrolase-like protein with peptidoglycan-binding domain